MSREVLRQQTDVASPPRPGEGRHLPLKVRIRDGHLDDRLGATGGERLRDEGGCPPGERPPDRTDHCCSKAATRSLRSAADALRGEGPCFDQSCFAGLVASPKPAIAHAPPADLP